MNLPRATVLLSTIIAFCAPSSNGQQTILSPRDSVFLTLDTNKISVNYGRPSMRGRTIMGGLVPWNKVWRTGANEATHFKTNFDMILGGIPVMRGTYTLWTLPSPTGWKFILNKQTGQWGTKYDESQDYARFAANVEHLAAPIETLTVKLEPTGKIGGVLKLVWENTLLSTTFEKNEKIRPVSPLDSAGTTLGAKKVMVKYSKPFARGRTIWGVVVPFDSVWRTGANAATELKAETPLMLGGVSLPAGVYTLYSIPSAKSCKLIVSKKPPGRAEYDKTLDVARVDMKLEPATSGIDPFTMWFENRGRNAALFKFGWQERVYSVDIKAR